MNAWGNSGDTDLNRDRHGNASAAGCFDGPADGTTLELEAQNPGDLVSETRPEL